MRPKVIKMRLYPPKCAKKHKIRSSYRCDSKRLTHLKQLERFFEDPKTHPKLHHFPQKLTNFNQFTHFLITNKLQLIIVSGINGLYIGKAIKNLNSSLIFDNTVNGELINFFATLPDSLTTSFNVIDPVQTTVLNDSIIIATLPSSTSYISSVKDSLENNFEMERMHTHPANKYYFNHIGYIIVIII
uniref:U3 small nucleolar RNA-associated protein 23 n=1 Tax=Strongyloides papillosus TaxID=174720 RepID=A0A0N5CBW8_STREA